MDRWSNKLNKRAENKAVDAFLEEIIAVSKKHGMSISHEDDHGSFMIEKYNEDRTEWLYYAGDAT